jgi:phosphatidylglycerol:prolipoprotein diacylglycerol transferase
MLGAVAAMCVAIKLASYYKIEKDTVIDLAFYLILFGILGARVYAIFLELPYYIEHPLQTLEIWKGGLAIHGGIISGALVVYFFAKKKKINFWLLSSLVVTVLPLAQTIGRWGNYFNQELFGLPTNLPWGIPIDILNRPVDYISFEYFHPTFLYESIGNLIIFLILIIINYYFIKKNIKNTNCYMLLVTCYLSAYSLLRFSLEFIRIDHTPTFFNLRTPQIASLLIIIIVIITIILPKYKKRDSLN